jgi:outer membrane protein insertion porin family
VTPLLLALLLLGQPAGGAALPGPSLVVLGVSARTENTDSSLVVRTAGIATGQTFTRSMFATELADAVRRIYGLGLFEQVEVDTALLGDGVNITFAVAEFPRLERLDFEGFRRIKLKDLESRVKARPGAIVSDKQVFDWRQEVLKLYKEKGFLLVKVDAETGDPGPDGRVTVSLRIEEGDQVRIRNIELVGNDHFPDEKIEVTLTNRQKAWYRKAQLKEDEFVKDLDRIVDFYKQRGFLDARVADYSMEFDQGWASITIEIEEGTRYYFGAVAFEGDSLFTPDSLQRVVRFKEGTPYNTKLAEATLADIYGIYSEQGYIYAQVVPVEDTRGDTVDITYQVAEGAPALVRLVMIEGNEQTHDKVIRREVSSLPGYTFKRSEVIRSQRDIFNLGFFEDVSLDYRKADTTGAIDLIYRVKEKGFFGTIGAGVTYSGPDGVTGYLELQQPNLFGRGQQASIKVEKGGKKTNFQVGFTEPWLFDTPTSAGFDVSYLTRKYDYYDKQEISGGLSFSRPLPLDYTRAYLGLRVTDAFVPPTSISAGYDPGENNPYDVRDDTVHKTAFIPSITLTRDSRDYIFNPTTGSAVTYTLAVSTGDIRYHRHVVDVAHYFPLFWKFSLMGRTRLGYITGFTGNDEVPLYDRFYAGGTGADGIRGYGDRTIGPRQGGYAIGGRALALFSLEYKLRLSPQLSFLAFADAGNTWEDIDQFSLSDLKRGAGVGVRLEIPMLGLLGFDFGYGFDRDGGGRWEPHFQIGRTF